MVITHRYLSLLASCLLPLILSFQSQAQNHLWINSSTTLISFDSTKAGKVPELNSSSDLRDTGTWVTPGLGFHFERESSQHPDQGPVYQRFIALIGVEFRNDSPWSLWTEGSIWYWRQGTNTRPYQSVLFSIGPKLHFHVYDAIIYGQVGIGSGIMTGFLFNLPQAVGLEFPLSNNLYLGGEVRRGLYVADAAPAFIICKLDLHQ